MTEVIDRFDVEINLDLGIFGGSITLDLEVTGRYIPGVPPFKFRNEPPEPADFEIYGIRENNGRHLPGWLLSALDQEALKQEILHR